MDKNEARLYEIFEEIGITEYSVFEHPAITSVEEADALDLMMGGLNLKNLLIREKKAGRFYMVIIDVHRRMDLKHFKEVTGWGKVNFASPEEMWDLLQVIPGAVTPLAVFNDTEKMITVVLGNEFAAAPEDEIVSFHPCRNTATLSMKHGDFRKFLEHMGCQVICEV